MSGNAPQSDGKSSSSLAAKLTSAGSLTGLLAALGFCAREAQHDFYGVPHANHFSDLKELAKACSVDAVFFLYDSCRIVLMYAMENLVAAMIGIVLLVTIVWLLVARPKSAAFLTKPGFALPLLVIVAAAKVLYYDAPALFFRDVLTRDSINASIFGASSPLFTKRVTTMWNDVVCSRVANGDAKSDLPCIAGAAFVHHRRVYGRYAIDAFSTAVLAVFGIAIALGILKQCQASPGFANVSIFIIVAVVFLIEILVLPSTYSRTARDTLVPRACQSADDCAYVFRMGDDENYLYNVSAATFITADKADTGEADDVLTAHLYDAMKTAITPPVDPHRWANSRTGVAP